MTYSVDTLIEIQETELIQKVLQNKYLCDGEETWNDVVDRIAREFSKHTLTPKSVMNSTIQFIRNKVLIPGGSILANLGVENCYSSLSNCYFIPIKRDSIEAIFEFLKEASRTYSWRGGVGTDITVLRPADAPVRNAARKSTGAVSFMPLISATTQTIGQKGRRGANLITIDVRHPDIYRFVLSKADPTAVFGEDVFGAVPRDISGSNISVKLTDAFMRAVKARRKFDLIFPDYEQCRNKYDEEWDGDLDKWIAKGYPVKVYDSIDAYDLLMTIAKAAHACGDPGVVYWDQAVKYNGTAFVPEGVPMGMNPCGEQILAPYHNCLLVVINLMALVKNPFMPHAEFDYDTLKAVTRCAVAFCNFIIDVNKHPLPAQREADIYFRKIGISITGLGDTCAMLGMRYSSQKGIRFANQVEKTIALTAFDESINLAEKHGCAPVFEKKKNRELYCRLPYVQRLLEHSPKGTKTRIMQVGLRNSAFTTCQPAGSTSVLANNCTSGIEPLYALEYERTSRTLNGTVKVVHYPVLLELKRQGVTQLPPRSEIFKQFPYEEAHTINWRDRIRMQAAIQEWVSDSISSTINLPENTTVETFFDIYMNGWEHDLKGVTLFRQGCKQGVLTTTTRELREPPQIAVAKRHKVFWEGVKTYMTVTEDDSGNPLEVFATLPKRAGMIRGEFDNDVYLRKLSDSETICRLISLALRAHVPISEIVEQLDKSSYSMFHLASIIKRVFTNYLTPVETKASCPECNQKLIAEGGCMKCPSCGWSKCE